MDEEFDRGGVATLAHGVADTQASFASRRQRYDHHPARGGILATNHAAEGVLQAGRSGAGWTMKRGRGADDGAVAVDAGWVRAVSGGHNPSVGAESPDSDMSSSSGSDRSINRGIKRMRLNHTHIAHNQHQHQQHQQQHQKQHQEGQGQFLTSAFDRRPVGTANSNQPLGQPQSSTAIAVTDRGQIRGLVAGDGRYHRPGGGRESFPVGSTATFTALGAMPAAVPGETGASFAISHRPQPFPRSDRALTDNLAGAPFPGSSNSASLPKSSSGGSLQQQPGAGFAHNEGRSSSFDGCASFSPFAPEPPPQARYVRGIRVDANAPSDVDYSNVNHALRQLHLERRMMASARQAGRSGQGWAEGSTGHPR